MARATLLLFVALAALALGPIGRPAAAATPAEQGALVEMVNQARAANRLPPVVVNGSLTAAAEAYAGQMAAGNFFSHDGIDGSTFVTRAEAAGYTGWRFLAENIAAGQVTPRAVFDAWMNSPGHRANILSDKAREIGIGHAFRITSKYQHYWTMELGARPDAPTQQSAPPPAGNWRLHIAAVPVGG